MNAENIENDPTVGKSRSYPNFHLLYPGERHANLPHSVEEISPDAWRDLGLDTTLSAFTSNRDFQKEIAKELSILVQEPDVIRYRQEIFEDLLNHPPLTQRLADLLPVIDSLARNSFHNGQEMNSLHEVAWRMGELQNIVDCIQGLADIFREVHGKIFSTGLIVLEEEIQKISQDPIFQNLVQALPDMLSKTRTCASVTIGVNLDASLRPVQATLLSINDEFFTSQSLLNKLFGARKDTEGIAQLHSVPPRSVQGQVALPISPDLGWAVQPMMVPLFADLAKILERTAKPIANELQQYAELQGSLFIHLRHDLIFCLGAVQFIQRLLDSGLPVCRPEIQPASSRVCEVQDSYNANLVLHALSSNGLDTAKAIVMNDIRIGPEGRILILTGPNQGGKTTYLQGVGLAQVLAQVGCFVPGKQARISLVDRIFTHFPLEERPAMETGRLGEEAARMEQIFQQITPGSLVLLNESLASTSWGESLYLAQDVVKALRRVGARAIFSTHLHELANRAEEMNESIPGESKIISVVSSPATLDRNASEDEIQRSYKIENRPPLGQSFAKEIAGHYGIRYEQLEQVLVQRGVISSD